MADGDKDAHDLRSLDGLLLLSQQSEAPPIRTPASAKRMEPVSDEKSKRAYGLIQKVGEKSYICTVDGQMFSKQHVAYKHLQQLREQKPDLFDENGSAVKPHTVIDHAPSARRRRLEKGDMVGLNQHADDYDSDTTEVISIVPEHLRTQRVVNDADTVDFIMNQAMYPMVRTMLRTGGFHRLHHQERNAPSFVHRSSVQQAVAAARVAQSAVILAMKRTSMEEENSESIIGADPTTEEPVPSTVEEDIHSTDTVNPGMLSPSKKRRVLPEGHTLLQIASDVDPKSLLSNHVVFFRDVRKRYQRLYRQRLRAHGTRLHSIVPYPLRNSLPL